ncbi:MAG: hypothetical protein MUO27_09215 [Sedimentisphaerales bacterium]|nr:hypothetical protein [Sedimentisphaerales bacterium]
MYMLSGRARRFESVVGTLILFLLIATAVGVYVIQRDVNMARFGVGQISPALSYESKSGGQIQPADEELASSLNAIATTDFPAVGSSEIYNADNLYEKIDGKAPMYQESGFVRLTTKRFANSKNPDLGLELYLYDMGNSRNAFSVYSRQKRADVKDLNDMPFGYKTSNAIYISHGRYYIEMIGFAESQELVGVMKGIAQKLVAQLPSADSTSSPQDEKDKIPELDFFPQGTVAGSWKLQLRDAFGFDGLSDTYSAQYKAGEQTATIFFSKRSNADDAMTVAKRYSDFLVTNGAKTGKIDSEILKSAGASILDFYGSAEIVFATGVFIGGVHEADNKQAAEKAAEVLIGRLKKIND